jgi:tetratricopeptide (TPR) repeat protein
LVLAPQVQADFKSHLKKGNKYYVAGNMDEARQEYFNAQASQPESAEAPYNIGNTYYYEGNYEEALRFFAQADALARHPLLKSFIAYNKGCALFRAGKESEAVEAFKDALRWNPKDTDAKYNIEWIRNPKRPKQSQCQGQPKPQQGKQSQMSKEDAERLLQMVRDKERKAREEQQKARKGKEKEGTGGKDW